MKKPIGAKPGDLRRQNYQAILQLFRDKDQLAIRDIMEVVSLSKTAITNILTNLIDGYDPFYRERRFHHAGREKAGALCTESQLQIFHDGIFFSTLLLLPDL